VIFKISFQNSVFYTPLSAPPCMVPVCFSNLIECEYNGKLESKTLRSGKAQFYSATD
jgi:hypothetical protein